MSQEELQRISGQLDELTERLAERNILERRLASLRRDLGELARKKASLATAMRAEERDVEKLEGLSLTNLFHTILSSKKEQLEKERQEFLAAKLKWDQCDDEWTAMQESIGELEAQIGEIADISEQHKILADEKKSLLISMGGDAGAELESLDQKLAAHRKILRELREAIDAGKTARSSLREVIKALGSAGNWGVWDMMGGGIISTAIKHSHIDKAKGAAARAQTDLGHFRRELEGLDQTCSAAIEVGGFATFADYFFDGLIVDWLIQSRINKSREGAERTFERLEKTMVELEVQAQKTKKWTSDCEAQRMRVLYES